MKEKILIAGPCALESRELADITITKAKEQGISMVRTNLWKPRTRPGFEGIGAEGIPLLVQAAQADLGVALEVMNAEQARLVTDEVLSIVPHAHIMLWIGSRNQNHLIQREIGAVAAEHENVEVMVKNQPWRDQGHWEGAAAHVLSSGIPEERVLLCHRGFTPWDKADTEMRNIPDLKMAQEVRENTGLRMILDPSHIGGVVHLVQKLAKEYGTEDWIDGQIIEVHPNPPQALTDAKQQLTWEQLQELQPTIAPHTLKGKH